MTRFGVHACEDRLGEFGREGVSSTTARTTEAPRMADRSADLNAGVVEAAVVTSSRRLRMAAEDGTPCGHRGTGSRAPRPQ